jgi:hypothetical protein
MVMDLITASGILTAIATIALFIVTGYLAKATIQLTNITKNQDKPWLHFYFMLGDKSITNDWLYVKNIGKGAALDVKFNVKIGGIPTIQQTLDALAPSQEFVVLKLPSDNTKEYEIDEISYKDINEKPINQQNIQPKIMNFNTYTDF